MAAGGLLGRKRARRFLAFRPGLRPRRLYGIHVRFLSDRFLRQGRQIDAIRTRRSTDFVVPVLGYYLALLPALYGADRHVEPRGHRPDTAKRGDDRTGGRKVLEIGFCHTSLGQDFLAAAVRKGRLKTGYQIGRGRSASAYGRLRRIFLR